MFLQKIEQLAGEWGKSKQELEGVAKESLLYGMRIVKTPGRLKRELKKIRIDSKMATPLWDGNFYLLSTLPKTLTDRKKKIPCLEDYLYAKRVLEGSQVDGLRAKLCRAPSISREEVLKNLMLSIRGQTRRGSFLPWFDPMHEDIKDIEKDVLEKALVILNKEWLNFRSPDNTDEMTKYLSYCLKKKMDTYLKHKAPKRRRVYVDDRETFNLIVDQNKERETPITEYVDLQEDLKKILDGREYLGVSLFLGFAARPEEKSFKDFLALKGYKRENLSPDKLKLQVEKHLGAPIFELLKGKAELSTYLSSP